MKIDLSPYDDLLACIENAEQISSRKCEKLYNKYIKNLGLIWHQAQLSSDKSTPEYLRLKGCTEKINRLILNLTPVDLHVPNSSAFKKICKAFFSHSYKYRIKKSQQCSNSICDVMTIWRKSTGKNLKTKHRLFTQFKLTVHHKLRKWNYEKMKVIRKKKTIQVALLHKERPHKCYS